MTKKRLVLLVGLAVLLWWAWVAPMLADSKWWDLLTTQIVGTVVILAASGLLVAYGRQAGVGGFAVISTILRNRWARWAIFTTVVLLFLITKREDLPWWWSDFRSWLSNTGGGVRFWLEPIFWGEAWDRLAIVVFGVAAITWGIRRAGGIRRTLGTATDALKTVPAIGGLLVFRKWWQMEVRYRVGVATLSILAIIYAINGSLPNLIVVAMLWTWATFRGWPRENPLDPVPVDAFNLPVLRAVGMVDAAVLFLATLITLTSGITWFFISGYQLWTLFATLALSQLVFLLYVDKRPGVTQTWTTVRVVPKDQQLIIDRARGWVGEISIAPLKLGPFRLKERKSIWDNLARIFGYYLFEVEPVGFRPEEGEAETLEFYVQCAHFRFRGTERTWTGARALINYIANL